MREDVAESLMNIENLIRIGKLQEAEKKLEKLSVDFSTVNQVWITYAKLCYEKYIGNYDKYLTECQKNHNSPLDYNACCTKCIDELKQYKRYCDKDSSEIDRLLEKAVEIKKKSSEEILNYFYSVPRAFCFDSTWGSGGLPIFTWKDKKGNCYCVNHHTVGVVEEYIQECKKNMEIYNELLKDNNKLNDRKLVLYLCGEDVEKALSKNTSWKVTGFNGHTLIIKYFYSDAWDNCLEAYATNILIRNNVKEILSQASKVSTHNGCYVATCVYGSYDSPPVRILRNFRDTILAKTWYGRIFIRCYYAISPILVKMFGNQQWFRAFWKKKLDVIVQRLNCLGYTDTYYKDKY